MTETGERKNPGKRDVRLTDKISLGVLAATFPADVIDEVVNETGKREKRVRLLPARVMVWYCLALCLFFGDDYEEVMRKLVGSLQWFGSWRGSWTVPSTSAITQARQRLGYEPLQQLFARVAVPVATEGTRGAWCADRRLMAIDGSSFDVPDTPANVDEFGRMGSGPKASSYPKIQVVSLTECGTHASVAAAVGGARTGEQTLAKQLLTAYEPGMLVLADRNFYGFTAWAEALETGADLLWRIGATLTLPVLRPLPDGSYLSMVIHPKVTGARRDRLTAAARAGTTPSADQAQQVRVVEYQVPDRVGSGDGELICLITSILDPDEATAIELAAAYHERWEQESVFDEIKTHMRGAGGILRSKSPDMVKQEIWALLLTHYAIRALMCEAADDADADPDRLAFVRSLRVVRRQVTDQAAFSPQTTHHTTPPRDQRDT